MSEPLVFVPRQKERVYLGHSILNGQFRYTSVTQIKMYDPSIEGGCPRKFFYHYGLGIKEQKKPGQTEGASHAETLEHYYKTGEDVLPPVLQEGKPFFPAPGPDLEVEKSLGPNIERAVKLRDALLQHPNATQDEKTQILGEIKKASGLMFNGIPLDGAMDWRHRRGEYVDPQGVVHREQTGMNVVSIGDLKVIKQIDSRWTRTRTLIRGYGKNDEEVMNDSQMVGYGLATADEFPDATHIRLNHVYCQKTSAAATIRGGLIPVEEVRRRAQRIENVVREMTQVVTAQRIEDVQPNTNACDDFVHLVDLEKKIYKQGCVHRLYCPLSLSQSVSNLLGNDKEIPAMSFFDTLTQTPAAVAPPPPPAPVPSTPVMDAKAYAAAVEAEKARLLADPIDAAKARIVAGTLRLDGSGQVADKSGAEMGWILRWPSDAEKAAFSSMMPVAAAVNPPDAPKTETLLQAARPMPPEQIALIGEPVARAQAEEHAKVHAQIESVEVAEKAAKSTVWCQGSEQTIALTMEMAVMKKPIVCQCGKLITVTKPDKQEDGSFTFTTPRHRIPKIKATEATDIAPAPPVVAAQPPAPPSVTVVAPLPPLAPSLVAAPLPPPIPTNGVSHAPTLIDTSLKVWAPVAAEGIYREQTHEDYILEQNAEAVRGGVDIPLVIFVDVAIQKGQRFLSLEAYYGPIVKELEQQFKVIDIQIAPKDSPLACAGWKGALRKKCQERPPTPANYFMRGTNEIALVVLDAIESICDAIYQG